MSQKIVTIEDVAESLGVEPGDTILLEGIVYRIDYEWNLIEVNPKINKSIFEFHTIKSILYLLNKDFKHVLEGEFK